MKLKTYQSSSVQAAVRLAKIELGEEAVFLGSRDRGDGEGGYEVTFARLESADDEPRAKMSAVEQAGLASDLAESFSAPPDPQPAVERYHWKSYLSAAAPARARETTPPLGSPEASQSTLAQPVIEAKTEERISSLEGSTATPDVSRSNPPTRLGREAAPKRRAPMSASSAPSEQADSELLRLRDEVERLRGLNESTASRCRPIEQVPQGSPRRRLKHELESRGLDEALADRLLPGDDTTSDEGASYAELREALENRSASLWKTDPSIGRPGSSPRIAALVGPPGCGKTSALAKLAIRYGLGQRRAMHLISVDQIRVGAMEPLEAYAALLGAPLSAVDDPERLGEELQRVCCGEARPDLVLIDTPGYAPAERERAAALAEALRGFEAIDVLLVLPGGLGAVDLRETAARFDAFDADKLLFTKLDETVSPGALLGEHLRSRRPVSFLSRGQRVPEDSAPAGARALTRLLLGEREQPVA